MWVRSSAWVKKQPQVSSKQAHRNETAFSDAPHLLKVQQMLTAKQKNIWPPSDISHSHGIWLRQTMTDLMFFCDLCGKLMGLLSARIKLPFNDMLDKSWFQHACYSEPKTFLISRTNRHRKDLNFRINKHWAGLILAVSVLEAHNSWEGAQPDLWTVWCLL